MATIVTTDISDQLSKDFRELWNSIGYKEQKKILKSAFRKEGNKVKEIAAPNVTKSGLGKGTKQDITKGLHVRVYPKGFGFMVSTQAHGNKYMHTNRHGKMKPVLFWTATGTHYRWTKGGKKSGKNLFRGKMRNYGFIDKSESEASKMVETDLWQMIEANLDKAVKRLESK